MGEAENKSSESNSTTDAAKDAAKEAAHQMKDEAQKALGEIKGRGITGFLNFDKFYFPVIARFLFVIIFILSIIGMVFGVLGGLVGMFSSFFGGIATIFGSLVFGVLGIFGTRIWFELIMIGFKINENLEKIRDK